jgi:hypothetical protein
MRRKKRAIREKWNLHNFPVSKNGRLILTDKAASAIMIANAAIGNITPQLFRAAVFFD